MKTRCPLVGALAVLALSAPLSAADSPAPPLKAEFVNPASPEARPYRDVGSWAIDRLAMTMITDATNSVARNGPAATLPICHLKDVPTVRGTIAGMSRVTAMKLTSLKLRNTANAPDAAEELALAEIKAGLDYGTPPRILVQRIEKPGGGAEWRVYKPLAVIRQCGNCHGNPEDQPPELRAALKEKYPNDQGGGFSTGEWRGIIRVTVADPPPPPAAPKAAPPKKS